MLSEDDRKRIYVTCLSLVGLLLLLALCGTVASAEKWKRAADLQQGELWKYRSPDVDDSTQYDVPRLPMVTRWLIWKKERVRAWYVPDAPAASPPPYRRWKILAFVDETSKKPISTDEVKRRFAEAQKLGR